MLQTYEYQRLRQEQQLNDLRQATGVTEPDYSRFPLWLKPRVNAAGLCPHQSFGPAHGCHSGWQACEALQRHLADDLNGRLFDHHGRVKAAAGTWLLVSEPYLDVDDPSLITAVRVVSDLLLLDHAIAPDSWWNPPSTIRITWSPKPGMTEAEARKILKQQAKTQKV